MTSPENTRPSYRWRREQFVLARDALAFERSAELVESEIWPVPSSDWSGEVTAELAAALRAPRAKVTTSALATGDSLPDPNCWVRRADAQPVKRLGARLSIWRPEDVLLVVEVSDETVMADLTIKAKLYGSAGYQAYWVITPELVYEHTEPIPTGYRNRREYLPGERIPVPYADSDLAVDELIAPS